MFPPNLTAKEFLSWANYQVNDFTTTEIERECLKRLESYEDQEDFQKVIDNYGFNTPEALNLHLEKNTLTNFLIEQDITRDDLEQLIESRIENTDNTVALLNELLSNDIDTPEALRNEFSLKERITALLEEV